MTSDLPKFDPLSDTERELIRVQLHAARSIAIAFADHDGNSPLELEDLDLAYAEWRQQNVSDDQEINVAIHAFAAAFGELFVRDTGLEWSIVADSFGTAFAVHGEIGTGHMHLCPVDFVAKRWHSGEVHFFAASFHALIQHFRETANDGAATT